MAVILVFLYLPIAVVVVFSFNSGNNVALWKGFTTDWYLRLLDERILKDALFTSLKVGLLASALSCVIGTVGAFSAEALSKKLRRLLNGVIYIPLVVPEIVMGVAYLLVFSVISSNPGLSSLVAAHTVFCIPYVYLLVGMRLRSFDKSIVEAGRDLGAKGFTLFRTVVLPIISPAVFSGAMLSLAMSLDDLIVSSFVAGPATTTLPMYVYGSLKRGLTPKINALCTIVFVFTFAAVCCVQILSAKKQGGKNE